VGLSLEYVGKETANNLRRNVLMSTAAVLCVAVSLALVGMALLIKQGVANATIQWKNGVDLSIFMNTDASLQQSQAVASELTSLQQTGLVRRFSYVNQDQAYAEFKKMEGNTPELVESVKATDLPPSYRVVPSHAELISQIGERFRSTAGVKDVVYSKDAVNSLLHLTHILQVSLLVFAGVLLLSAGLLIVNTIRMAIYSRRREVAVMKLVGATNWFIRIPFMVEGMIQGLVGAGAAFVFVYAVRNVLHHVGHRNAFLGPLVVTSSEAIGTGIFILLVGAFIGVVGSGLAVTQFLDV